MKVRLREIFILAGAYISYGVGASFGTGIGLLQYHGGLGVYGILSQLISAILTIILIYVVSKDCGVFSLHNMNDMFSHYCGKYLGSAFQWFTVLMLFLFTGTMFSGAAETMYTTFSVPRVAGTAIVLFAVALTVFLGAKKLIDIIGNIAPIILVVMLIICVYSLIFHSDSLASGSEIIRESAASMRVSNNPIMAGLLEFGLIIIMTTGYLATVAAREGTSRKELVNGNVAGEGALFIFKIMLIFAFILNASVIAGSSVPVLTLGSALGSGFGKLYSIILLLAIYTTAAGMAWQVVINICPESSKFYKPLCILVTVAAYGFTFMGPFGILMKFVNIACSYVGVIFIASLLYTKIVRQPKMLANQNSTKEN